jgi:hypothetical protein
MPVFVSGTNFRPQRFRELHVGALQGLPHKDSECSRPLIMAAHVSFRALYISLGPFTHILCHFGGILSHCIHTWLCSLQVRSCSSDGRLLEAPVASSSRFPSRVLVPPGDELGSASHAPKTNLHALFREAHNTHVFSFFLSPTHPPLHSSLDLLMIISLLT